MVTKLKTKCSMHRLISQQLPCMQICHEVLMFINIRPLTRYPIRQKPGLLL